MEYEEYRRSFFVQPQPEPRYRFSDSFGVTLYFAEYEPAAKFYEEVLGPPAYIEGNGTKGWAIGNGWLTLLHGQEGSPQNVEITFEVETPVEADRLQAGFIAAGGAGEEPSDQLMYRKIRFCPVVDPFGTHILIISPIPG
jgi:hypothetical protein